ncbi:nitronate monooxygenase [Pseudonocardia sp. RS11V-5]|uniref:NAD(P)H-dependent flavin oxidoreductase n=1 Tax=Pseudonocardia terrae TaxID=2905831 RepID=UPI001E42DE80|nr:nitronate monooxygenase [Pseudonocardia terrae]MCE3555905.1 nitronate monooxygenase [Pseudonocardia terrae]
MTAHEGLGRLPAAITDRLRLPVIAAPMLRVSGPELVSACCNAGVIGAFPTANARSTAELDEWFAEIAASTSADAPPCAANIIIRSPRAEADLEVIARHRVQVVITSVGSPAGVVAPLHEAGALVLADVATLTHAQRAVAAGADALILLSAGAGGQTGWMNPFAFVRAVRAFFDGPIVLAGGISDGHALRAARVLGCDLAYMGTRFIAAEESRAAPEYKQMLVDSTLDDVVLTRAFTGLATSMLRPSIVAAGLDPATLDEMVTPESAAVLFGGGASPRRWTDVRSAGHTVSGVDAVRPAAEIVEQVHTEFTKAE